MWALREVPVTDDEAATALLWGLRHPDEEVKIQAALSIAHRFKGQDDIETELLRLLRDGPSASTQAACLYALGVGWPTSPETSQRIEWARSQAAYPVRIAALHLLLRADLDDPQELRPEERLWLIELVRREDRLFSHPWKAMVVQLLDRAAAGNRQMADFALETLRGNGRNGGDRDLAWALACRVFSDDDRFLEWTASELGTEHGMILFNINMVPQRWREHPTFQQVLAPFVTHELTRGIQPFTVIGLSRSMTDEAARAALLEGLDAHRPWSAARELLKRFGEDATVVTALRDRLLGNFKHAAPLADVAIDVLGLEKGFELLIGLLRHEGGLDEHQVLVANAVANAWGLLRSTAAGTTLEDGESLADAQAAAQRVLERHDAAEVSRLCTQVSAIVLSWHVPSIISAWPDQGHVIDYARRALQDSRHITVGNDDLTHSAVLQAHAGRDDARSRVLTRHALDLLGHLDAELREVLAFELTRSALEPAELIATIALWKTDPDLQVRRTIMVGTARNLIARQEAAEASGRENLLPEMAWLREQIREDLCAYGPELEEDRQIAWIGMLLLQDLTLIDGLHETFGEPNEPGVKLTGLDFEPDPVLTDLIAANWPELEQHFGDRLYARLTGRTQQTTDAPRALVLAALASVAAYYPHIAELLRSAYSDASDGPVLRGDRNVILWAKRDARADLSILTALVSTLTPYSPRRSSVVIASLLDIESWNVSVEDFAATLTVSASDWDSPDAWVDREGAEQRAVYAQLFPRDPVTFTWFNGLSEWFTHRAGPGPSSWTDTLAICFSAADPADLPILICRVHERLEAAPLTEMRLATGPLLRRLATDPAAVAALHSALGADLTRESSPLFARFADPVVKAHPNLARLRRTYLLALVLKHAGQLKRQQAAGVTAFLTSADPTLTVHDPFAGSTGPLWLSLMDLLTRN
ncbi:hypothetical protein ACGFIV_35635 [Sphaerisporangium sp. NPDC049003]|uniref:hypothetical protein n=1 Tax=Sphaerisporangium sp. NPDC049003 TaxID=3364517 RepID=UPI0037114AA4